jgi:hypothetical protein
VWRAVWTWLCARLNIIRCSSGPARPHLGLGRLHLRQLPVHLLDLPLGQLVRGLAALARGGPPRGGARVLARHVAPGRSCPHTRLGRGSMAAWPASCAGGGGWRGVGVCVGACGVLASWPSAGGTGSCASASSPTRSPSTVAIPSYRSAEPDECLEKGGKLSRVRGAGLAA